MKSYLVGVVLLLTFFDAFCIQNIVISGGGSGADAGDKNGWNYNLYNKLIPDHTMKINDGILKVVVLTGYTDPTEYLPTYFQWLGTERGFRTDSRNYQVVNRTDANNITLVGSVANADVIFISGGDQGQYYHEWKDTILYDCIKTALKKGASIGGTSAGAMILAGYSFSGGSNLVTPDVLEDSQTVELNDIHDGKSAIHTDFLPLVQNAIVDTHFTERVRLGRLLGVLGRAVEDSKDHSIIGIGLEQKTGIWIHDGIGEIIGVGSVNIVRETNATYLKRDKGYPLIYTNLQFDRLTEGWKIFMPKATPDFSRLPSTAIKISYEGDSGPNTGELRIYGDTARDMDRFDYVISYTPNDFAINSSPLSTYIKNAFGITKSYDEDTKASKDESLFRAIYEIPSFFGMFLFNNSNVHRTSSTPDVVEFTGKLAGIIIDAKTATYKSLSLRPSNYAINGGKLKAAGLTNMTLHVLADSYHHKLYYNTRKRIFVHEQPK